MKKQTLFFWLFLAVLLAGCGTMGKVSPTPGSIEGAGSSWIVAQITQQAEQALYTPTMKPYATPEPASVGDLASTAVWAEAGIVLTQQAEKLQAQDAQATLNAEIYHDQATQDAQGTEVANSATQTQVGTAMAQTAISEAWTQTMIPTSAYKTQMADDAQSTIQWGYAVQVDMATKRQRWAGAGNTILLWVVIAATTALLAYLVKRLLETRELPEQDEQGNPKTYLVEGRNAAGKKVKNFIKPKHIRGSSLTVTDGRVEEPEEADNDHQQQVTKRAQAVELVANLPNGNRQQGMGVYGSTFGAAPQVGVEEIDSRSVGKVLDAAETDALEE